MAASRKEYELLFQLKAALGSSFSSSFKAAMQTTKQLQGSLNDVKKVQGDISAYKKQNSAIDENKKKLALLIAEQEKLQREMQETENPSDKLRQNLDRTEKQIAAMTGKIKEQEGELDTLGNKLRGAGVDTGNLNGENERLRQTYSRVAEEQEKLAGVIAAQDKNNAAIAKTRTELLKTVGVATALGASIYKGFVEPAAEFKSEMSNLAAITGATTEEIDQMAAGIREIARIKGTPLMEVASNAKMLAEAGGDINLMMEQLTHGTNLATATQSDMATTLDFVGSQMKTFDLQAEDTQAVVDSFAYVTTLANLELGQLGESYVNVGGSAAQAGMSIDDVNALMVTFSNAGLKGGAAGTSLNAVLRNLSTPTSKAAKALKELKVSLYDSTGASRNMFDIMGDLEGSFGKMSEEQRNRYQNIIFDSVAQKGWNMITAEGIDNIAELRDEIAGSAEAFDGLGQAAGMAAKQADNLNGDTALVKSELKDLSITMGDLFMPNVREAVQRIAELINKFGEFAKEHPEVIKNTVELAFKLLALRAAGQAAYLGFLHVRKGVLGVQKIIRLFAADSAAAAAATATGAARATTAIGMLRGAFSLMMGPVGLVVAAVGLATAGFLAYRRAQYQARQDTLHFSDNLVTAADHFQEVSDKAQSTRGLIEEYKNLKAETENVATSAERAAEAKERMKAIEDLLIEQNPDVLNKYDQENGRIAENLDLLERKTQREMELARMQYEQAQYDAEQKLPDAAKELSSLERKTKALDEQYQVSSAARNELRLLSSEWEAFDSLSKPQEEVNAKLEELTARANEIKEKIGYEGYDYRGAEGFRWAMMDFKKFSEETPKLLADITKSQEELDTVKKSFQEYYDTSIKLVEIDLGSGFQTAVTNLENMKKELAGLAEKGEGGSDKAQELQTKIAELEPKVETAAVQIRDLGASIEAIPEVKTIDVEGAMKNVDGFIQKLNEIPPSKKVQLITEQVNEGVEEGKKEPSKNWFRRLTGLATGGIVQKPSIVHFAEDGPEAAIPLDGSDNAKRLWAQAGEMLGMYNANRPDSAPAFAGASAAAPELKVASGGNVEQSIVLHSNPVIHVNGEAPGDLERQLQRHDEDLLNKMEEWYRRKKDDERRQRYG